MAVDEDMRRRIFYTGRPTRTVRATDEETTTRADGVTHAVFQHKVCILDAPPLQPPRGVGGTPRKQDKGALPVPVARAAPFGSHDGDVHMDERVWKHASLTERLLVVAQLPSVDEESLHAWLPPPALGIADAFFQD